MNFKDFPLAIQRKIKNLPYNYDNVGESDAGIIIFKEMVLKIEESSEQSDREYNVLKYLKGKLLVPEIIAFSKQGGYNYLIMSRIQEKMTFEDIDASPEDMVSALADGIKQFWSVDISECNFDSTLDHRLKEARRRIDNNLVNIDDFEEDTIGENGFKDIEELYCYLVNNRPKEDLVFTHGDYCLPNIFSKKGKAVGFIDLGKAGIADKWQDIALCVRSLKYNLCKIKGLSEVVFLKRKEQLYNILGVTEEEEKLQYYILLDELF